MEEDKRKKLAAELNDAIMEKPYGITVGEQHMYLYPASLGKTILLSSRIDDLGFHLNEDTLSPYTEAIRLIKEKKKEALELIALHTLKTKDELFDIRLVEERSKTIEDNATDEELASLLIFCLSKDNNVQRLMKFIELDKENERKQKVNKAKESKNTYIFGGKSMFGSLIDMACERYGWTYEYVVWGISYVSLQMTLADQVSSIYLTDDEMKRCHVTNDREHMNADDPRNFDKILSMNWD